MGEVLHFTRLRLKNWRNFSVVDVPLRSRIFVVGPNAAGKSNLLDVFRFLRDVAPPGGLERAVADPRRGSIAALRCLAARQKPDVEIDIAIGSDASPDRFRYKLVLNAGDDGAPVVKSEGAWQDGKQLLGRPNDDDRKDPRRLRQTYLQTEIANADFRELADFLRSTQYLHVVPQVVRDPDRRGNDRNDPFGGGLIERIARTSPRKRKQQLKRIESLLQSAVPQLASLQLSAPDAAGQRHLEGKYQHWRPRGAWQSEQVWSDGTLRLIGLLWSLIDGSSPLLLEEPELSLHTAIVARLPSLFAEAQQQSGRQVIVSTHSPELLSDPGIAPEEVLLLTPDQEGTRVESAGSIERVRHLLEGGINLAEAVLPYSGPLSAHQLTLFES